MGSFFSQNKQLASFFTTWQPCAVSLQSANGSCVETGTWNSLHMQLLSERAPEIFSTVGVSLDVFVSSPAALLWFALRSHAVTRRVGQRQQKRRACSGASMLCFMVMQRQHGMTQSSHAEHSVRPDSFPLFHFHARIRKDINKTLYLWKQWECNREKNIGGSKSYCRVGRLFVCRWFGVADSLQSKGFYWYSKQMLTFQK